MAERFPYDDALKLMALADPPGFLEVLKRLLHLAPEALTLESSAVSGELHSRRRHADLVWRARGAQRDPRLLHVEFQLRAEKKKSKMEDRLLEYFVGLYLRDHLPVQSVVIYLQRTRQVATPPLVIGPAGDEMLRFKYWVVRLWEEPYEQVLSQPSPELWPLAGAMAGITEETLAAPALKIVESEREAQQKQALLDRLGLLAGLQLKASQIENAFRRQPMVKDLWRASSITREAYAEGKAEGRAEAKAQGLREAIQGVLESRFGPLNQDIIQALGSADEAMLKSLVARVATETLEQVRERLDAHEVER
jgi:predicted transposase YdaD